MHPCLDLPLPRRDDEPRPGLTRTRPWPTPPPPTRAASWYPRLCRWPLRTTGPRSGARPPSPATGRWGGAAGCCGLVLPDAAAVPLRAGPCGDPALHQGQRHPYTLSQVEPERAPAWASLLPGVIPGGRLTPVPGRAGPGGPGGISPACTTNPCWRASPPGARRWWGSATGSGLGPLWGFAEPGRWNGASSGPSPCSPRFREAQDICLGPELDALQARFPAVPLAPHPDPPGRGLAGPGGPGGRKRAPAHPGAPVLPLPPGGQRRHAGGNERGPGGGGGARRPGDHRGVLQFQRQGRPGRGPGHRRPVRGLQPVGVPAEHDARRPSSCSSSSLEEMPQDLAAYASAAGWPHPIP